MKTRQYKKILLLLFLTNIFYTTLFAQCGSSVTMSGSIFINNTATGTVPWTTPENTQSLDNAFATAALRTPAMGYVTTNYLMVEGFGFSIPSGSTICGIRVDITHGEILESNAAQISDNVIRLIKGGTISGSNKASSLAWSGSVVTHPYGTKNNTWGVSWTADEINSSDFGIAISSVLQAGSDTSWITPEVDYVSITVYYDAVLPVQLTDFTAEKTDGESVNLRWTTISEKDNNYFSVERSKDAEYFEQAQIVKGAGNSIEAINYSCSDEHPYKGISYYRLKQVDNNGVYSYSVIRTIYIGSKGEINMYPVPACDKLHLQMAVSKDAAIDIELINTAGQKIKAYKQNMKAGNIEIQLNLDDVEGGLYLVKVGFLSEIHLNKLVVIK